MAVRNFWIDADIDGRKTDLSGGPRSKDGGFILRIYQRDNGSITTPGYIEGHVDYEGNLTLRGRIGDTSFEHKTKR